MDMGVPVEVLSVRVNRHDDAGNAVGQVQCRAHIFAEALVRDTAQVLEQVAIVTEIGAQHLRDAQRDVTVWDRVQDALG
jgi:hypothetical protein